MITVSRSSVLQARPATGTGTSCTGYGDRHVVVGRGVEHHIDRNCATGDGQAEVGRSGR